MAAYADEVAADLPWGWWKCDEASGNLVDSSGSARGALVAEGAVTYRDPAAGTFLYGVKMAGAGSFSGANIFPFSGANWTIECWCKRTDPSFGSSWDPILGAGATRVLLRWDGSAGTGGAIDLAKQATASYLGTSAANGMDDSQWHHVVCVKSGTSYKIYVDGVERAAATDAVTWLDSAVLYLGQEFNATVINRSHGSFHNLALYTTALLGARVVAHYNAGMAIRDDGASGAAARSGSYGYCY